MPNLVVSKDCCGCSACANQCAKNAITMQPNAEGFLYPRINERLCVECGACEKVCPALNLSGKITPPKNEWSGIKKAFIIQHKNEDIRYQSTSGGAFTAFAEYVIMQGGIVFGAEMTNELKVKHSWVDTIEGLARFRNSKYVQSEIGNCYKLAKDFLKEGRLVCFSGTPCQISGLKSFLNKEYENLLTIDLVCKSVPSPLVFEKYLEYKKGKEGKISDVVFRDKKRGFLYCTMAHYSSHKKRQYGKSIYRRGSESDEWLRLFLSGKISRTSCLTCPYQVAEQSSDITLGDIWETGNSLFDDNKGTTKIYIWSNKGLHILRNIKANIRYEEVTMKPSGQKAIKNRFPTYPNREQLFQDANLLSAEDFFNKYAPYNLRIKAKNLGRFLLWKVGAQSLVRHIKHLIIHRSK